MSDVHKAASGDKMGAAVKSAAGLNGGATVRGDWTITCRDADGNVKWIEEWENIVVNVGLDYLLDTGLSAGAQTTSWFVGLTDGTPTVAPGDTMASHVGWAEVVAYSEATREAWVDGGVSAQSVDNSGAPAQFTINAGATTVGGAFLTSVSTKGGVTGILYAAGAFTGGDKVLGVSDTIDVTATFTQATP
jgi:hypothetical protein